MMAPMFSPTHRPVTDIAAALLTAVVMGWIGSCAPLPAQSDRVREVASLDGVPQESIRIQGRHRWLRDPGDVRAGLGALEVGPDPDEAFYGATIRFLRGAHPRHVRFAIHNPGPEPVRWYVSLQGYTSDASRRRSMPFAPSRHDAPPGWSDVSIDLGEAWNEARTDRVDCSEGLAQLRVSRRKRNMSDPPLRIDTVRFIGEDPVTVVRRRLVAALSEADLVKRRRVVGSTLHVLPDHERVTTAIKLLKLDDVDPSTRRAAREAIARCASPGPITDVLAAIKRARGAMRLELCWALASMPLREARAAAFRLVTASTTPSAVRCALLQALGRPGMDDVAPLSTKITSERPWPERAALVRALIVCATPGSVDALIEILDTAGSVRVKHDAADGLTRLTGKDLGDQASVWRAWWKANPGARLDDTGRRASRAYATYYGIPVPPGRVGFVIDLSGSMRDPVQGGAAGEHVQRARHLRGKKIQTRLDLAREELIHAIDSLPDGAWVHVVTYSDAAEPVITTKGPQKVTRALKKKLATRLRALSAKGRTNIHDGLLRAFHPSRKPNRRDVEDGPDTLFLLTDGNPSTGPLTSRIELRDAVLAWNLGRMIRIHTINLGASESRWLQQLARDTDGRFLDLSSKRPKKNDGR